MRMLFQQMLREHLKIKTNLTRMVLNSGAIPVVLGGDHAITFPVVRAYNTPLHVILF
ncbi:MAG: hypothetical protein CM1200mP33_3900 [Chloroflexota bacterium]|nr:MAG: hypothetical protein CM1200mP33_3900 [Chloroflexota bacterium]